MNHDGSDAIFRLLESAVGATVRTLLHIPTDLQRAVVGTLGDSVDDVRSVWHGGVPYLACRYHQQRSAVLVVGPMEQADGIAGDGIAHHAQMDQHIQSIRLAANSLYHLIEVEQQQLELTAQLEVTSRSVLAVTSQLSLEVVLHRIVDLARELTGAQYGALGVPDAYGGLEAFLTAGMSAAEEAQIPHRPLGLGILGLLLREPRAIRLHDLAQHPASVGFPANHPPMTSFLGVPIISKGQVLGNLYLTEKRTAPDFTDTDLMLMEILARHAGVAIDNAHLYQELAAQRHSLELLVGQLPEAVILVERDPDRITLANEQASRLLGWEIQTPMPLADFLRQNVRRSPDGKVPPERETPMVRVLRHGELVSHQELQVERPAGDVITILVNSAPMLADDGQTIGAITTFQDITQIKDAEQLKDDFLSLVSHELRTPLTTIRAGALMLQRDWRELTRTDREEILNDMAGESHRLGGLIENMVQLAHIRAGRTHLETEPAIVARVVGRAVAAALITSPDRTFDVDVPPTLVAEIDVGRIDQVLRNLLQNAVKYSGADTSVSITARQNGDSIEFAVRDYGSGIAHDELVRVFDRFHRSEHWKTSSTPGMGLGLYLARHVIDAHGGEIWAERPEDGGTRLVFTVPTVQEES